MSALARNIFRRLTPAVVNTKKEEGRFIKPLARIADYKEHVSDVTYEAIEAWHKSADFLKVSAMFGDYPSNSLVGGIARELLYHLIRSTRAKNVVEIGTYFAATSEVMARALWENGEGVLHTTDPYGAERCPSIISQWPAELQRHIRFYPLDSMEFFTKLESEQVTIDIAFIDGNHDYEFAYFDLCCAAKLLRPGGIVLMDNVEQPGPFWAALEFLRANPDWKEVGHCVSSFDSGNPFAEGRAAIGGTSFVILKAPSSFVVKTAPRTTGQRPYAEPKLSGLDLKMSAPAPKGVLHMQIFLRGFSNEHDPEQLIAVSRARLDGHSSFKLKLPTALETRTSTRHTMEAVLFWEPDGHNEPLQLSEPPQAFAG